MLKLSDVLKNDAPGLIVIVSFEGLIRSGSTSSFFGGGPIPNTPFSPKTVTLILGFKNEVI